MMGIPMPTGASFAESDGPLEPAVAVVNETAAQAILAGPFADRRAAQLPIAGGNRRC